MKNDKFSIWIDFLLCFIYGILSMFPLLLAWNSDTSWVYLVVLPYLLTAALTFVFMPLDELKQISRAKFVRVNIPEAVLFEWEKFSKAQTVYSALNKLPIIIVVCYLTIVLILSVI